MRSEQKLEQQLETFVGQNSDGGFIHVKKVPDRKDELSSPRMSGVDAEGQKEENPSPLAPRLALSLFLTLTPTEHCDNVCEWPLLAERLPSAGSLDSGSRSMSFGEKHQMSVSLSQKHFRHNNAPFFTQHCRVKLFHLSTSLSPACDSPRLIKWEPSAPSKPLRYHP
uniref:Uncharacterized protein n=1 Tax=Myotis myotis TaxID=51298 RepID=A0A7J7XH81_MYOMY|nr:hypothetical protein mMyoMyo1_011632 [Myotis myotis]